MDKYVREKKIGEGTFAVVYLAHKKDDPSKPLAIKKFKVSDAKEGVHFAALREIRFLQELNHPNLVQMLEVFSHKGNISLVLEYLETDLEKIITKPEVRIAPEDIKSWMIMALRGIDFCHKNFLLHRDIKPNNFLVGNDGILRLADFGLARMYEDFNTEMTPQVVTLWYRAPELLLGAKQYGTGVDIWAMGCVFAELLLRVPYMAGETDLDQLNKIFSALGTPTERDWPGLQILANGVQFRQIPKPPMKELFTAVTEDTLNLLAQFLAFDPLKRPSAEEALSHDYFRNLPRPTPTEKLRKFPLMVSNAIAQEREARNGKRENEPPSKKFRKLDFDDPN